MAILIDASILIAYERGTLDLPVEMAGRSASEVRLSVITVSELLHGVSRAHDPTIRATRSAFVEHVLANFQIVEISLETVRIHAPLWADLEHAGTPIGRHDSWLAATCLQYGLTMVTANEREFRRVPGLTIENWSKT